MTTRPRKTAPRKTAPRKPARTTPPDGMPEPTPLEPMAPVNVMAEGAIPGVVVTAVVAYVQYIDGDEKLAVTRITSPGLTDARAAKLEAQAQA